MTCMEAEKMVIPYIEDDLTLSELVEFMEHIEACPNCREELEIHYMVTVGLKKLDEGDGAYDIIGDLKRKLEESAGVLRRLKLFQIACYAVDTLSGMALLVMVLLQLRIWIIV
ncbi:MAG: zf-HC2 domain-containing protein [Lachnospiraceae bacterium]|nr:zf-HC2 domain-containing protein [Lachnospiraceae bacterium]